MGRKPSNRSKLNAESGTFEAEDSSIRPEDKLKDMAADERKAFMQRRKNEEEELETRRKVSSYHYEIVSGKKLIKRVKKANGATYSFYIGNCAKDKSLLEHEDVKKHLKK